MFYLNTIKKQMDEFSLKLQYSNCLVEFNADPTKRQIARIQVEHTKMHQENLNNLLLKFTHPTNIS